MRGIHKYSVKKNRMIVILYAFDYNLRIKKNVSEIVPEQQIRTFSGLCKRNETFEPCEKQSIETVKKVVWSEKIFDVLVQKCSHGYTNVSSVCVPICSADCINGICVSPNKCECNEGFIADKNKYGWKN